MTMHEILVPLMDAASPFGRFVLILLLTIAFVGMLLLFGAIMDHLTKR